MECIRLVMQRIACRNAELSGMSAHGMEMNILTDNYLKNGFAWSALEEPGGQVFRDVRVSYV